MVLRVLTAIVLSGCLCTQASATLYSVVPVGTLPSGTSSTATSVDNSGEVAGYTTFSNGSTEAFIWTQAGGLVGLGGTDTEGFGVNSGNVVGVDDGQAFRWTSGSGTVLLDPSNQGQANAVNSSGEAVGSRVTGASTNNVLTWSSSNTINLYALSSFNLTGTALNDSGWFVGLQNNASGYYDNGTPHSLGTFLPGALSDNEIAAGSSSSVATLENLNTLTTTTIGSLPGDTTSNALGINPLGTEIVGVSDGHGGFVYNIAASSLQSLDSVLAPAYSGWSISSATAVNDSGDISAVGVFGGVQEAVLLVPTPEPSSLILAALALAGLVTFSCRGPAGRRTPQLSDYREP